MSHETSYVKAISLKELVDVETIKAEVSLGNIIIVRITGLAKKSVEQTRIAINELLDHVQGLGGDIARLGEERIVLTPPGVKIWRREHELQETEVSAATPEFSTSP